MFSGSTTDLDSMLMKHEIEFGNINKAKRNGTGMPISGTVPKRFRASIDSGKMECRFLVPNRVAGRVIGKGGENVKRLRTEFNATVSIPDSTAPERIVYVIAEPDNVVEVIKDVLNKITESRPKDAPEEKEELKYLIHQSQAGAIIGKAGGKMKELRDQTHASVKVFRQTCPMSTDRVVSMSGERENILNALKEVLKLIAEAPAKGTAQHYDSNNYTGEGISEYGGFSPDNNWKSRAMARPGGMMMGGNMASTPGLGMGMSGLAMTQASTGMGQTSSMMGMMPPQQTMNMMGGASGMGAPGAFGQPPSMTMMGYGAGAPPSAINPMGAAGMGMGMSGGTNLPGTTNPEPLMDLGLGISVTTSQVTIPKELAGTIIGRGGEHLSRVKMQSGAHVVVEPLEEGAKDRIITIRGTPHSIQMAQYLLQECCCRTFNPMNTTNPTGMGMNTLSRMNSAAAFSGLNMNVNGTSSIPGTTNPEPLMNLGQDSNVTTSQVTIPKELAGTVIGRGGQQLSRIKMHSGAHVIVEPLVEGASDRIITIKGTAQAIQMAQYLLQECVRTSNWQKS